MSVVGGRLKYFYQKWKEITTDSFILETVKGYKIPFNRPVRQRVIPTVKFANTAEEQVVADAIGKLIEKGAVRSCKFEEGQFLSSFFTVPKSDGSVRFILNLKSLNSFIEVAHFKMEDVRTARKLISKDCFMAKIDLEDAYLTVPIHPDYTKYLRFVFRGILYEFIVLPFGLCTAPLVFTKIMKPLLAELRKRGYTSVMFIDDKLLIEKTRGVCIASVIECIRLLSDLGFIVNRKKSVLDPNQRCIFLGFILDSTTQKIELTLEKRTSLIELISSVLKKERCKIVEFASLLGKLVAACPAVDYGYVYTKILERDKTLALEAEGDNYDRYMNISEAAKEDFSWWLETLPTASSPLSRGRFSITIHTDASTSGWGASSGEERVFGTWNEEQREKHINYLELLAARLALLGLASKMKNCNILLRIDNTTAIAYINKMGGTHSPCLNSLARMIWQWAERSNNFLVATYIKSSENVEADYLSRVSNLDTEWTLSDAVFNDVIHKFGHPEIDLFATLSNSKCEKYISRFPEKEAIEVDAFTVEWTDNFFYAFPPFALVLRTLEKIISEKACGILVVPDWPNQAWYPTFKSLVVGDPFYIHGSNIFLPFDCRTSAVPRPSWSLIAAVVSSNPSCKRRRLQKH